MRHLSGDLEEAVLGRDIDQEFQGAVWPIDNKHLRLVSMWKVIEIKSVDEMV